MTVVLLRGRMSAPSGTKPTFLQQADHTVVIPALGDDDCDYVVRTVHEVFEKHPPELILGRSRGVRLPRISTNAMHGSFF